MSIQQQKANLINWIESINDESILQKIATYKDLLAQDDQDWWQNIPESHKTSIKKGIEEAENGQTISLEEFRQLYADRI